MIAWCFVGGFWMQLLYSFFITEEIRTIPVKRLLLTAYGLAFAFLCYQVPITILCLQRDLSLVESIGYIVFLILFFIQIFTNGKRLLNNLKKHKRKANFTQYDAMILKTKILLGTCIGMVVIILAHDIVFNFALDNEYNHFPISLMITGFVEIAQMIIVMLVLSNGNYKKYVFFRRVRNLNSKDSSQSSGASSGGSKRNFDMSSSTKSGMRSYDMESRDIEPPIEQKVVLENSIHVSDNTPENNSNNNSTQGFFSKPQHLIMNQTCRVIQRGLKLTNKTSNVFSKTSNFSSLKSNQLVVASNTFLKVGEQSTTTPLSNFNNKMNNMLSAQKPAGNNTTGNIMNGGSLFELIKMTEENEDDDDRMQGLPALK
ncbi:hypothetical protein DLAC_07562 [Tieghemostelium lacteum]|uniref:Transmembrane protein n=1 Tax=Tieghemostelium lacteum TaxID=361077 RepID=A0A151ZCV2_TIELA|nr:hypothetical protein DLAC_07562 [Tieghemostelium lacteum]|eukprot:KYQ91770.1 hypothetical protein DLAC_07562 [Tieghemostelium lacteum]